MVLEIVRENSVDLILVLKRGKVAVEDLASATEARFVMRRKPEGTFQVDITETPPGTKLLVDDPATGSMRVKLDSLDTSIAFGDYDISIQATFSGTRKEEFVIKDKVKIVEQITEQPAAPSLVAYLTMTEAQYLALTETEYLELVE